jgi:lipopolysaccharide/colanic/teichoic acid biosynthesis glycosyltransferase
MKSCDAEFQVIRVSVQPGITGMWQVSLRSDSDLQAKKLRICSRPGTGRSGLYILAQTLPAVLSAKGAK